MDIQIFVNNWLNNPKNARATRFDLVHAAIAQDREEREKEYTLQRQVESTTEGRMALFKEGIDLACSEAACELLETFDATGKPRSQCEIDSITPIIRTAIEFSLRGVPFDHHPDPLAAKLERLAGNAIAWKWRKDFGGLIFRTIPLFDTEKKDWHDTPLAAVDAAIEELNGGK